MNFRRKDSGLNLGYLKMVLAHGGDYRFYPLLKKNQLRNLFEDDKFVQPLKNWQYF